MAAIALMAAIGAWAILSGRISYVVTDGVSMNPVYYQGDLVFVLKADSYHVGEIVAYHGAVAGQKVLHRIIGGDDSTGFVFKGDNNDSIDPLRPTGDQLIGHAVLHVPKGGFWLKPLMGPTGLGMLGFLVIDSGAAAARTRRETPRGRRKKRVKAMARQEGSMATAATFARTVKHLSPALRAGSGIVAVMALLGLVLAVLGWLDPVYQSKKISTGPQRTATWSYSAKVPKSAAYDGTTVTAPDPVFRKLANKVDLKVTYSGPAGVIGLSERLTNGTGWHSTTQLVEDTPFVSTSHSETVTLDLNALAARSQAAAKAIGSTSGGTVSIALEASVRTTGLAPFQAPLTLQLDSMQLAVAADTGLTAGNTGPGTVAVTVPRQVTVLGTEIMTASQARSYALLFLIVALVGGFGIYLVQRRDTVVTTRAEIERRYPQLLVHVEPMASPPGKPVVNVDNFPALVKLAERYGQMILTWRRPDADDFVVRDEGITYRYRVQLEEPATTLYDLDRMDRSTVISHRPPEVSRPRV